MFHVFVFFSHLVCYVSYLRDLLLSFDSFLVEVTCREWLLCFKHDKASFHFALFHYFTNGIAFEFIIEAIFSIRLNVILDFLNSFSVISDNFTNTFSDNLADRLNVAFLFLFYKVVRNVIKLFFSKFCRNVRLNPFLIRG